MRVGFDTEYEFARVLELTGGRVHPDITTMRPVCACLSFEDGRRLQIAGDWDQLQQYFDDPRYTFVVHGAHAEWNFCKTVGLRFPVRFIDTFLAAVLIVHAEAFRPADSVYKQAALVNLAIRYGLPFIAADEKDEIRDAIMHGTWAGAFSLQQVLDYCSVDAGACLKLYPLLLADLQRHCGPRAEQNLRELYQPHALVLAEAQRKGIRLDQRAWDRLLELAPRYRDARFQLLRGVGYDHDGGGIGTLAFERMIRTLSLASEWPMTKTGRLSTKEEHLKDFRHLHPALNAVYEMVRFDSFMGQDIGGRVDRDGKLRCGILPLAQHTGRNSTIQPNLMGIPGEFRPLLLPDDGCAFLHFDFSQQEPAIAGYLSGCTALIDDFTAGDVYVSLGHRLGLLKPDMTKDEVKRIRNSVLKSLMLAILYGKSARSIARDLGIPVSQAFVHLRLFQDAYHELFDWLRAFVAGALERGWAENIIGYRAGFQVLPGESRGHVARSAQNFPIQSAAASCFQLTGVYLAQLGCDIRLPLHDAYLLSVPDDRLAFADCRKRIMSATGHAVRQLFPGLARRRDIETLHRFAKNGNEDSFEKWLEQLEAPACPQS